MTLTYWWAALPVAVIVFLFWACVSRAAIRDRPPHPPEPGLWIPRHLSDTGERDRPGDDDQWRRLKPMAPHIRRLANAEKRAEETGRA